ncbi:cysteine desulfurase [Corynebacterium sp. P7202]|uniref:Cysteine desulfurase family protein n=1 Tax=Corynebacterium pygosceleis TaxID=2800406 RepID=A0A9Q4C958_9CORY|nr:cysteine desulfurase family protein [Corynebacterium pygosceleis]MCK7637900.1 cysteine desulfurase [Corynebacterium pygosceleis]MCX7468616.1 cysteine desulfurase family protein [Corynebacterium pygosceleis]
MPETPHYLDHAATAPIRRCAVDAWADTARLLNPGGQYASGRLARAALEEAREQIAAALGCEPVEVIFTGSGTESCNIAVQGLWRAGGRGRIISTPIEHPAVAETVTALAAAGAEIDLLPVGADGVTLPGPVLDARASLVTCMWANNETGAIQPVAGICARAAAAGTPVHVDATQVVGHLPVDFAALGATTLAAGAHKFGGPRGVGLLIAKRSPAPTPVLFGGGQERGIRPGTANVAGAVATAAALTEAVAEIPGSTPRITDLRDRLQAGILDRVDDVLVHGADAHRLPGHLHLSFPGAEGDSLIMLLDNAGIACSTGSACSAGVNRASDVLLAMGVSEHDARGAVRFTLGPATTDADVDRVLEVITDVVSRARIAGMA